MRIKRILFTLLVALMMFSLTAVASFAIEELPKPVDLDATAEINGSDLLDGVTSAVQPSSEIELTVKLPENPGMGSLQLKLYYSAEQLTFKSYENGEVFSQEPQVVLSTGLVTVNFQSRNNVATRGAVIVIKFAVVEGFHGDLSFNIKGSAMSADSADPTNLVAYQITGTLARTYKVHNYGEPEIVAADCSNKGSVTYTCADADCTDRVHDWNTDKALDNHSFTNYESDGNATCLEDGTKTAKCDRCDETDTQPDVGSKLGHEFLDENYKSDENATCLEDGTKTAKCTRCDVTDTKPDVDSKLGHEFLEANYKSDNNATCTADGTKTAKCTRCDVTDTVTDEGSMLPHTYGNWSVTTQPTTSAQGEETRTCSACPAKETRPVKKLPVVVTAPTEPWEKGDGEMTFKSDADFADFEAVLVNGEVLAAENYTVKEGSIIVTLTEKYLKSLENGEYTICIKSANGSAESTFTVENSSGWIVAIIIIAAVVVCAGTVVGVVLYKKKKAA